MNVLRSTSGDICDHKMALKMSQEFPPLAIIHLAKYNIMNKQTNKQTNKNLRQNLCTTFCCQSQTAWGGGWRGEGGGWRGRRGRGVISVTSQCSQRRLRVADSHTSNTCHHPRPLQLCIARNHTVQRAQDSTYGPTALSLESGSSAPPIVQCKWRSTLLVKYVSSGAFNESVSRLGLQCD